VRSLKDRGLTGVQLVISDACLGLVEAVAEVFPQARRQPCVVHWYRNVFSLVPNGKVADVARMLKAIHVQEDRRAADAKAAEIATKLAAMKLPKAAALAVDTVRDTLTYYAFPSAHWRQVRTNNPMERIIREIRRRTRVVGAFPDGQSALMLVAARLRHVTTTRWGSRRSLSADRLLSAQGARGDRVGTWMEITTIQSAEHS
jgi:putative transposase